MIRLKKCECKEMIRNLIDALEDCIYGYTDIDGQITKHLEYRDKYDDMIDEYEKWLNG